MDLGAGHGLWANVQSKNAAVRQFQRQGNGDITAARAHIHNRKLIRIKSRSMIENGLHQQLSFGTRNEGVGRADERPSHKHRLLQNVFKRHALLTLPHNLLKTHVLESEGFGGTAVQPSQRPTRQNITQMQRLLPRIL